MRISLYFIAAFLLLLASCRKDNNSPGTFKIQFQPKFGSADLKLNTNYSTPDGKYLNFTSVGLYLSHIRLVKTDNSEVEVDSAVLLLYQDSTITFSLSPVGGSYKAIKFGIGLDSSQNKRSPSTVPDNDPVYSNNALYWDNVRQHLFIQMEGYAGTTPGLGSIFFYHVGNDSINTYRTAMVNKSFSISAGQTTSLVLNADLEQVFYGANSINVITAPSTHTRDYPDRATIVANEFAQIFSIQ